MPISSNNTSNESPNSEINIADQFPVNQQCFYLNHAAVAPWPRCTSEAVQAFAEENCQTGAKGYLTWLKKEQQLTELIKQDKLDISGDIKNIP